LPNPFFSRHNNSSDKNIFVIISFIDKNSKFILSIVLDFGFGVINEKTNYVLGVEYIKKGREIDKVVFSWTIMKESLSQFKELIRKDIYSCKKFFSTEYPTASLRRADL
jgi:hypothetical protein